MSNTPLLRQGALPLEECLPKELSFLDNYQQTTSQQIVYDGESHNIIRGKTKIQYMLDGLKEEIGELVEPDRVEPNYSRIGALILMDDCNIIPGSITESAVNRHIKEFGDVSWYLSNYLTIFNISLSSVIKPGVAAIYLDEISNPRSNPAKSKEITDEYPWLKLLGYAGELTSAATNITRNIDGKIFPKKYDERLSEEKSLVIASGKFIISMMHMAKARFNLSYQDILEGNQKKINKRIENGTVFDKTGGDDR